MSTGTSTATAKVTVMDVLAIVRLLPDDERRRLAELLALDEDDPLPEYATIVEAIELFLADACSMSRAAALAGVTRWDILDELRERDITIPIRSHRTAKEMDALAEELRCEGIL